MLMLIAMANRTRDEQLRLAREKAEAAKRASAAGARKAPDKNDVRRLQGDDDGEIAGESSHASDVITRCDTSVVAMCLVLTTVVARFIVALDNVFV